MAQNNPSLVVLGEVVKVEGSGSQFPDDAGAWRIKVRLDSDGTNISDNDLTHSLSCQRHSSPSLRSERAYSC